MRNMAERTLKRRAFMDARILTDEQNSRHWLKDQ
jgi:hypothetical protein